MTARTPAMVWPVGWFVRDEMNARGWSDDDLHRRLGHDPNTHCAVDLVLSVADPSLILDEKTAAALGRAFGVSPEYFLNLDRAYREAPADRRQPLEDAP